jgi:hypothetical protein
MAQKKRPNKEPKESESARRASARADMARVAGAIAEYERGLEALRREIAEQSVAITRRTQGAPAAAQAEADRQTEAARGTAAQQSEEATEAHARERLERLRAEGQQPEGRRT